MAAEVAAAAALQLSANRDGRRQPAEGPAESPGACRRAQPGGPVRIPIAQGRTATTWERGRVRSASRVGGTPKAPLDLVWFVGVQIRLQQGERRPRGAADRRPDSSQTVAMLLTPRYNMHTN